MLRNLVTSLFQHEQIKTTLPKARETARLAEKIIGLGKNQGLESYRKASGFVLDQSILPKLFGPLARRYAERPGGYTRIHKFGNRLGDNAPTAILELVDNPRDIRLEVTARAVGWELLKERLQKGDVSEILQKGVDGAEELIMNEITLEPTEVGLLRPATRWNLQKVLRFRGPSLIEDIARKAQDHIHLLLAKPVLMRTLLDDLEKEAKNTPSSLSEFEQKRASFYRSKPRAGQVPPGETKSALRISQGALAKPERRTRRQRASRRPLAVPKPRYTFGDIYGQRT